MSSPVEEAVARIAALERDLADANARGDAWREKYNADTDEIHRLKDEMSRMFPSVVHQCCVDVQDARTLLRECLHYIGSAQYPLSLKADIRTFLERGEVTK